MKFNIILASLLLFVCNFSYSKDAKLTIENYLDNEIRLNVYKVNSWRDSHDRSRRILVNKDGDIKISGLDTYNLTFKNLKNNAVVLLWVEIKYKNGSIWESAEIMELLAGNRYNLSINIDEQPQEEVLDFMDYCPQETLSISFGKFGSSAAAKTILNASLILDDNCYVDQLKQILYDSMWVIEEDKLNDQNQASNYLGGLAILRVNEITGNRTRINFIQAEETKTYDKKGIKSFPLESPDQIFYFDSEYLNEKSNNCNQLIPCYDDYSFKTIDHLYKLRYTTDGLRILSLPEDVKAVEEKWPSVSTNIRELFIEDFIHATRSCSKNEYIEVLEYNKVAVYNALNLDIDEYEVQTITPNTALYVMTKEGPYYLKEQNVVQSKQENRILAIGFDDNVRDYTQFAYDEAIKHLEKMIANPKEKSTKQYKAKLKDLNYGSYPRINNDEVDLYKEYLKVILEDLLADKSRI